MSWLWALLLCAIAGAVMWGTFWLVSESPRVINDKDEHDRP